MKLVGRTTLSVTIDPNKFLHAAQSRKNFDYLIHRFYSGEETDVRELETWGVTITMPPEAWMQQPSVGR